MATTAVRIGTSWLAESDAPHAHWVENPGDAAIFADAATATAYASARNVTFTVAQVTVTGKKNVGNRNNNA